MCPRINRVIYLSASPSRPSRSLALSLSRLNGAGNSLCARHLEEASTTLSQPLEHFHKRGALLSRAGRSRLFNISQNAESRAPLTLATALANLVFVSVQVSL